MLARVVARITGKRTRKHKAMAAKDGFDIIQEVDAIEDAAYYVPRP